MIDTILKGRLWELMESTDEIMEAHQKYNIPHFVDMKLLFYNKLFKMYPNEGYKLYGFQYKIGNLFVDYKNTDLDMAWTNKLYMNQNMELKSRAYTPFILFHKQSNGNYRAFNTNNVSIYKGVHGTPFLQLQCLEYIPPEDIKVLLLPCDLTWTCSELTEIDTVAIEDNLITLYFDTLGRRWIPSRNNMSDIPYDIINLKFYNYTKYFTGTITATDIAIKIGLKFGEKVYMSNILLFNSTGELIAHPENYLEISENNIYLIKPEVIITGWTYIVFYYTESNKSINTVYSMPQYIIDHDTITRITGIGNYILGEDNFNNIIKESNSITVKDLREYYASSNDPVRNYDEFLTSWLNRVLDHKKSLVEKQYNLYPEEEVEVLKDINFKSVTYSNIGLASKADVDNRVELSRVFWEYYDEEYSGLQNLLVFCNRRLCMECIEYDHEAESYFLLLDDLEEKFGIEYNVEIIWLSHAKSTIAELSIPFGKNNEHILLADRYHDPRYCNIYTYLKEPVIPIQRTSVSKTYKHPLVFRTQKIGDKKFNIQFDENWIEVPYLEDYNRFGIYNKKMINIVEDAIINTYSISDLYDNNETTLMDIFVPVPESSMTITEGIYEKILQCKDRIYISRKDGQYTSLLDIDGNIIHTFKENIIFNTDNFPKDKLSILTESNVIYEVDKDNNVDRICNIELPLLVEMNKLTNIPISNIADPEWKKLIIPFKGPSIIVNNNIIILENVPKDNGYRIAKISIDDNGNYLGNIDIYSIPDIVLYESSIIKYNDSNILIYGGKLNNKIYKYNIIDYTIEEICNIPEDVPSLKSGLIIVDNDLYIFGGYIGDNMSYTINKYNLIDNTWTYLGNIGFQTADPVIVNYNNFITIAGGDISDSDRYANNYISVYDISTDTNFVVESEKDFKRGTAIQDKIDPSIFYIMAYINEYTLSVFKLDAISGSCTRTLINNNGYIGADWDIILSHNHKALCLDSRNSMYTGTGTDITRYEFTSNNIKHFLIDHYGNYMIIVKNFIFLRKYDKWNLIALTDNLENIGNIVKIVKGEWIYAALLSDGNIYTSSDFNSWYQYNLKYVSNIKDIKMNNGEYPALIISTNNKTYINPYQINMSSYYDNHLILASINRFAYQVDEIIYDSEYQVDAIDLGDDFIYCMEENRYQVYLNGRLLDRDMYKIAFPDTYNPINKISIYFKFSIEEDCTVTTLYLPFNTDIIYQTSTISKEGLITMEDNLFSKYGIRREYYWFYSNGEKITYDNLENISDNIIRLKQIGNVISSSKSKSIEDSSSIISILRTQEMFNLDSYTVDQFNSIMNRYIEELENFGIDKTYIENIRIIMDTVPNIDDKIILLRIYADHYVAANDKNYGNTPKFDLDGEYKHYPVLDANIPSY